MSSTDRPETVDERTARLANEAHRATARANAERELAKVEAEVAALRASPAGKADDLELVRRLADAAARQAAEADELGALAYDVYRNDAVAHMRAELAIRVAERGPAGKTIANLRDNGYERGAEDLRAALRLSAMVALVLVDRPLPGDNRPDARESAAGVLGGFLAEVGAPGPVELAGRLLRELERAGLAFTYRPGARPDQAYEHARRAARRADTPRRFL